MQTSDDRGPSAWWPVRIGRSETRGLGPLPGYLTSTIVAMVLILPIIIATFAESAATFGVVGGFLVIGIFIAEAVPDLWKQRPRVRRIPEPEVIGIFIAEVVADGIFIAEVVADLWKQRPRVRRIPEPEPEPIRFNSPSVAAFWDRHNHVWWERCECGPELQRDAERWLKRHNEKIRWS